MIHHSKPTISALDRKQLNNVLNSGMLAEGAHVKQFEQNIAAYLNVKKVLVGNSGSGALIVGLSALHLKKGAEIILPSYVCDSVLKAVLFLELKPAFCDIGEEWTATYETIAAKVTKNTGAILLVHTFGINCFDARLKKLKLPIIEDFCQAFGAKEFNGVHLNGDIGIYSFHATKCLTTGEGGAFATNNEELFKRAKELKSKNAPPFKLSDLQACIGISQLQNYDSFLAKRAEIAELYFKKLPDELLHSTKLIRSKSIFFRFPICISTNVDEAIKHFTKNNISVRRGVDSLLHVDFKFKETGLSNTLNTYNHTLSLPIYPSLTKKMQLEIITCIKKWI